MRKIKFRALNEATEKIEEISQIIFLPLTENGDWAQIKFLFRDDWLLVPSKAKLMQFTGLSDKNGREVYFKDIVRWGRNTQFKTSVVIWSITLGGIYLQTTQSYTEQSSGIKARRLRTHFGVGQAKYSEIIGNIHENPELLEGTEK